MSFRHNLRKQRSAAGLSQEKLAEKMSVSRQTISKWENGSVYPSTSHIFSLARILNCGASELMDDEPNKKISQELPSIASYYRTAFHKKIAYWLVGAIAMLILVIFSFSVFSPNLQNAALIGSKIVAFDRIIDGSLDNFLIMDGYLKMKVLSYGLTEEDRTFYIKCNLQNADSGRLCSAIIYFCGNNGDYSYKCQYLSDPGYTPKGEYYELS